MGLKFVARRFLPLMIVLLTLLSGCVKYDVRVNFKDQHHGEIVQTIILGQRLTTLNKEESEQWLDSIEQRAKLLGGSAKRFSPEEVSVTIPFNSSRDLTKKFNQFFNPTSNSVTSIAQSENSELLQLESKMITRQSNLIFFERNYINLNVDLRALGVLSNQGNVIVSPGSLIDLEFTLLTPWPAKPLVTSNAEVTPVANQLIWHLQPGKINTLEAVFWLPSYLGIGTGIIVVLMLLGYLLKYKRFPGVNQPINTV